MKRKIVLAVSLLAGIIAALMARFYIAAKDAEVKALKDSIASRYGEIRVVVFNRDLPAGTVLQQGDLGSLAVPALGLRGQAVSEEEWRSVIGRKILLGHKKRDVLFWADIEGGDPQLTGLSSDIKKTMRAISINCSGASAVSSMVKPNDHVDLGSKGTSSKDRNLVTCTILQNVLVLATGQRTAKSRSKDFANLSGYATVTLEVTPREAEMLAFAEQIKGRLVLTLRNRNDVSYEKELPKVDFEKIHSEIEELNARRQQLKLINR